MGYDQGLAERLRDLLAGEEGLSEQRMFGGLAFLVGGHMAVSASSKGGLLVRVDPELTFEMLAESGTSPFEMRGSAMRGWLRVDAGAVSSDGALMRWAAIGVATARSMPARTP